ncbi:MAG: peptidoglycan DD-metalloendopeptidase family protein, partial [Alphaproteobacteria bacterium]|nr:peptidoglycan DD-metalloendopeptidase family protein [Alphaproteobacteria bacterium]
TKLKQLTITESNKIKELGIQQNQLTQTLKALQRLSLQPIESFFLSDRAPVDIVHTGLLLQVVIPTIKKRAAELQNELAELQALRTQINQHQATLAEEGQNLKKFENRVAELINLQKNLTIQSSAEQKKLNEQSSKLAQSARDLRELLSNLTELSPSPLDFTIDQNQKKQPIPDNQPNKEQASLEALNPQNSRASDALPSFNDLRFIKPKNLKLFPTKKNSLLMPATGQIILKYGDTLPSGETSRGTIIQTRPGAQIIAPFDGQVKFRGPFRSYGEILIIEHGRGYHSLLAGLSHIDAEVGQWLLEGEPVGSMDQTENNIPSLYFEIRLDGNPLDPLPWLITSNN